MKYEQLVVKWLPSLVVYGQQRGSNSGSTGYRIRMKKWEKFPPSSSIGHIIASNAVPTNLKCK